MEFSIKFDAVKSAWSIIYIEGSQVIFSPKYFIIVSLKVDFVIPTSADT